MPRSVDESLRTCGSLNVLVHSAGVFLPQPFEQYPAQDLDLQWEINVRVPFVTRQAAIPHLRPGGSVIFISSIAGHVGFPRSAAYCATKGAIELMAKALTLEFARDEIRFNCIAPGNIRTALNEHLLADPAYDAIRTHGHRRRHRHRRCLPGRSDAASYVYGAGFVIDEGWTAG